MSCGCTDLNLLVNQANSIVGGCYPTPTFASGGSYAGVLLTGSTFTVGSITGSAISGSAISGTTITGLPTPILSSDAAPKSYVDSRAFQGPDVHPAVEAATTLNVVLGGGAPSTVDGRALALNDRVLVKNQADNRQNGLFYVAILGSGANGTWLRVADAEATGQLKLGAQTYVKYGTANGGSLWVMSNTSVPVLGTDPINFTIAYSIFAVPATKITGQLIDSQIAGLEASKLTGTLTLPYDIGTNYNRVRTNGVFGLQVGINAGVGRGFIALAQNAGNNGISFDLIGNGAFAKLDAVTTSVQPVRFKLSNDAGSSYVELSSAGTVYAVGSVTAGSLLLQGPSEFGDDLVVTNGSITLDTGNLAVSAGTINTSGVTVRAKDFVFADKTITPAGTTGNRTINAASGSVNFATGTSSLVVTNSLVNANSIILVSKGTNDAHRLGAVVPAAGSFTIYMDTAHSGECRVNFLVTN